LLIFALCLFPINFYVGYENGEFLVKLRYLFFKKALFPTKKKQNKDKKEQNTSGDDKKQNKKDKEPFLAAVNRAFNLFSSLAALSKLVLSLHRAKYKVQAYVGGSDASETAVNAGKYNAALYSSAAVLENFVNVKKKSISVFPDYDSESTDVKFSARFYSYPLHYVINIHKILPLLLKTADALPPKKENKGEKKQ